MTTQEKLAIKNLFVDFTQPKNRAFRFLKNDKNDGVTSAYYYTHIQENQNLVFDTDEQFEDEKQCYTMSCKMVVDDLGSRTLTYNGDVLNVKNVTAYRFKSIEDTYTDGVCLNLKNQVVVDEFGVLLGILAQNEIIYYKITF